MQENSLVITGELSGKGGEVFLKRLGVVCSIDEHTSSKIKKAVRILHSLLSNYIL